MLVVRSVLTILSVLGAGLFLGGVIAVSMKALMM
jgi:hypothetical protein